eukprot:5985500-Amphidinium_carterae.1
MVPVTDLSFWHAFINDKCSVAILAQAFEGRVPLPFAKTLSLRVRPIKVCTSKDFCIALQAVAVNAPCASESDRGSKNTCNAFDRPLFFD